MELSSSLVDELTLYFGDSVFTQQTTVDEITTLWVIKEKLVDMLSYLKNGLKDPFTMLYDLSAIDERSHSKKNDSTSTEFTLVYHLLSFKRNQFIRIKVALQGEYPQ